MTESATGGTLTTSGAPLSSPDDAGVAAGLVEGRSEAVDQVRRWIRGAALPFRRSLGAELEDLEQETLLVLTDSLRNGQFEGRSRFATYVRRTMLYRCINRARDLRRRESEPIDPESHLSTAAGPERLASGREEVRAALRVMAKTGEACRQLWRMIHEGLTYAEMSARVGVEAGTLRVRVLRCRQKAMAEWRLLTGTER